MKKLIGILVLLALIIVPVSAEITYSDAFYTAQDTTSEILLRVGGQSGETTIAMGTVAQVYELRQLNEILRMRNELLVEQNALISQQNDLLIEILSTLKPVELVVDVNETEEMVEETEVGDEG